MWPFSNQDSSKQTRPDPQNSASGDACPVDHETRQAWLKEHKSQSNPHSTSNTTPSTNENRSAVSAANTFLNLASSSSSSSSASSLSTQREVSSIPRLLQSDQDSDSSSSSTSTSEKKDSNWVYPSPSQFFQAMKRKAAQNLYDQPKEEDMPIVVPIHNAVNERAWKQLLEWENTWDSSTVEKCGGVKLVSFIGKPKEKTWRAWTRELMGYQPPFDRHDWLVDRCGHRVRYIIDFYSGKQKAPTSASSADLTTSDGRPKEFVSFYLDVRPAPDTLEGWLMRGRKSWKNWTGI